ncbi:MAG: hypothetical protein OJF50_004666 [Nitrospira sp.]|nr:hypothetical protein [Nitrospira sp.]
MIGLVATKKRKSVNPTCYNRCGESTTHEKVSYIGRRQVQRALRKC